MPDSEDPKQVSNNDLRNSQFGGGLINAETVNAGRVGGDIWNIFLGQPTVTPVGNPARPKNERLLLATVKQEVTARLSQSLHNTLLINLGKELQPQQVKRPWDTEIKIGLKPAEVLSDSTTILDIFDSQEIAGKLLILGNPGSGKTTTQLELAQALIQRAEEQPDYPVPVLFNLSSWKDNRQTLTDWLLTELNLKYGVSTKLGKQWVENHQLLLFLDALDELKPQRQEICVQRINQLLLSQERPSYMVICSRSEEYNNYSTQLQLNGAVCLQPFNNNQIYNYLFNIKRIDLWAIISNESDLLELVKTPLLLSITVLAMEDISLEKWQYFLNTEVRLEYLLNTYVSRMLEREVKIKTDAKLSFPKKEQTIFWLYWLAQQLKKDSKTELLIEQIQPYWLVSKNSKKLYKFIFGLIFGLIAGLSGIPLFGLIGGVIGIPLWGVIRVLILEIFFNSIYVRNLQEITLIENIAWFNFNYELLDLILFFGLVFGLVGALAGGMLAGLVLGVVGGLGGKLIGLITGLITGLIIGLIIGVIGGLVFGLVLGLVLGLFFGLVFGLAGEQSGSFIETKLIPNQGIWKSSINAVLLTLLFGVIGWLIFGLHIGVMFGVITGLFCGEACIQHFSLRLVLYFNGYIPWNYTRFLNYCTERMLLQRVGGRYRFIHKLLQDHFAQMDFKRDSR
ncbi:NACHT domain-containing protein [Nostoc sp. LEGE 12450]|nr:NACHT domain-containing protein [Nostoc sp. LEGE 12450]